jgi:Kef-type K+ transport system membrane component KefB
MPTQSDLLLNPNPLTIIGLIIAVALLGSKLFQRFGVPQVVGFS